MSTPGGRLRKGGLVTLGRFNHTYRVEDVVQTALHPNRFSEQTARSNPTIYRFRNLISGSVFCLSHGALSDSELGTYRDQGKQEPA